MRIIFEICKLYAYAIDKNKYLVIFICILIDLFMVFLTCSVFLL